MPLDVVFEVFLPQDFSHSFFMPSNLNAVWYFSRSLTYPTWMQLPFYFSNPT